jgi:MFS superfamily sulfate permease-like transporter
MGSASHLATRLRSGWLRSDALAGVTLAAYLLPAALGDAFCVSWGEISEMSSRKS